MQCIVTKMMILIDSSNDSALSDDSDKLSSGVFSDEESEASNGSDGNQSNYDNEDCDRELNDSNVAKSHVEKGLYGIQYVPNENEKISLEKRNAIQGCV